jgi:hypothetical protein
MHYFYFWFNIWKTKGKERKEMEEGFGLSGSRRGKS